jgi:putative transposase
MSIVPVAIANEVAAQLDLSQRTIYVLIQRFRQSGGLLTSIAPNVSSGGRGKSRLLPLVEQIITMTIHEMYLTKQKHTAENVAHEIRRRCIRAKLNPPSFNTIRDRICALSTRDSINLISRENCT